MKKIIIIFLMLLIILTAGCSNENKKNNPGVTRYPPAMDLGRGKLTSLPAYNQYSPKFLQVDLRSHDLTALNLKDRLEDLMHADFDTSTRWPYNLPEPFNPKKITEYGKNPGLNVTTLHDKGITGKGVGIAIIGGTLLADHSEYSGRLKVYEEIKPVGNNAEEVACAIASIAVGKSVGVAPEAELYYIATAYDPAKAAQESKAGTAESNGQYNQLAVAIDRILQINKGLPYERRIRIICIEENLTSQYIKTSNTAYLNTNLAYKAIERAKDEGIFVIFSPVYLTYNGVYDLRGLGRNPLLDPDDSSSYSPGIMWSRSFYTFERYSFAKETLLLPMDSRCVASPTGQDDYAFYSIGDRMFPAAYAAGLYALGCKVKPNLTQEVFFEGVLATSDIVEVVNTNVNYKYRLRKVVNPVKLMEYLQGLSKAK